MILDSEIPRLLAEDEIVQRGLQAEQSPQRAKQIAHLLGSDFLEAERQSVWQILNQTRGQRD